MNVIPEQHLSQIVLPIIAAAIISTTLLFSGVSLWQFSIIWLILSNFAQAPLFIVGLRYGSLPALIAGGLSLALISFTLSTTETLSFENIVNISLWHILPVGIVTHLMLTYQKIDNTFKVWAPPSIVITGIIALAYGLTLSVPLFQNTLGGIENTFIEQVLAGIPAEKAEQIKESFQILVPFWPSIQVIPWLATLLTNVWIAQTLLNKIKKSVRPPLRFSDAYIPTGFLMILAFSGVIGYLFFESEIGKIASNIAIVTLFPYFLMGLGTIRLFVQLKYGMIGFTFVMLLFLMIPALTVVVTMLGIFEPWLNLRKKLLQQK